MNFHRWPNLTLFFFGIVFSDNSSLNQLSYLPIYLSVHFVFQLPLHPKDSRVLAYRCPGPEASMPGLAWGARMIVLSLRLSHCLESHGAVTTSTHLSFQSIHRCPIYCYRNTVFRFARWGFSRSQYFSIYLSDSPGQRQTE